jgi:Flp pilus assembly pilin Flp
VKIMMNMLKKFWMEEDGGQVVEWPLIAAILALLIIAAWAAFGTGLTDILSALGTKLTGAAGQVGDATLPGGG